MTRRTVKIQISVTHEVDPTSDEKKVRRAAEHSLALSPEQFARWALKGEDASELVFEVVSDDVVSDEAVDEAEK
jgi:hypothetical protein